MTKEAVSPKKHSSPRSRWLVRIILLTIIGGYFWLNPPGVITQRVAEKYLSDPGALDGFWGEDSVNSKNIHRLLSMEHRLSRSSRVIG